MRRHTQNKSLESTPTISSTTISVFILLMVHNFTFHFNFFLYLLVLGCLKLLITLLYAVYFQQLVTFLLNSFIYPPFYGTFKVIIKARSYDSWKPSPTLITFESPLIIAENCLSLHFVHLLFDNLGTDHLSVLVVFSTWVLSESHKTITYHKLVFCGRKFYLHTPINVIS